MRKLILECDDIHLEPSQTADNLLHQSKLLFGNLLHSERESVETTNFFHANKEVDGSVPQTNEQKDVDEYLNLYLDRIEQSIKGTEHEQML